MPAKPRWLLAIPDAIGQFEELDRPLLTRRRDLERLFGVSLVPSGDADADVRRGAERPRAADAACRLRSARRRGEDFERSRLKGPWIAPAGKGFFTRSAGRAIITTIVRATSDTGRG